MSRAVFRPEPCVRATGRRGGFLVLLAICCAAPAWADGPALAAAAAQQIGITTGYDGSYRRLAYPGGDVAPETGVCTDVLIRAYRQQGIDLQVLVHEDMRRAWDAYPGHWGLSAPDRNIDHRRVPNLEVFLDRHATVLPVDRDSGLYLPGDVVSWRLDSGLPHIGIVSAKRVGDRPLILHNIGAGVREEDVLFAWKLVGHWRYPAD